MKLVYLKAARDDLIWLRRYYTHVFPEGAKKASKHIRGMKNLLLENPFIGKKISGSAREMSIPKTPFSYIYRVQEDRIEVLGV